MSPMIIMALHGSDHNLGLLARRRVHVIICMTTVLQLPCILHGSARDHD